MRRFTSHSARGGIAALLVISLLSASLAVPARAAPEKVSDGIRFTYTDANAGSVSWAGAFNGWNTTANSMTKDANGVWSVVVPLPAGEQQYKFVVDGQWIADPENPVTGGDFGNSVVTIGPDGNLVAQAATSNTPYSPKILVGGRATGWFTASYDRRFGRYELDRPAFDIDVSIDVRVSSLVKAYLLLNVNPSVEDVQDYRSRLNYKRGSIVLTQPGLRITAFDSDLIGTWDDPLHLVGDIGVFGHPYGFQRAGVKLEADSHGFGGEMQFSDNTEDRSQSIWPRYRDYTIDNFPTFAIGPSNQPRYVFETDPIGRALSLLRTARSGAGYSMLPAQAAKVSSMDFGDAGHRFGFGDSFKDVFAARVRHAFPGGLSVSMLGRSDRGFNLGRLVLAEPVADSTVRVLNTLFSQQSFGAGLEASWQPLPTVTVFAEALRGGRRMSFVNGSNAISYPVDSVLATRVVVSPARAVTTNIDGDHRVTDDSGRYIVGGRYSFAHDDIALRGSVRYETHDYPAWTQAPIIPAGQPPDDHPRFETVEFQRASYLDADRDLENSATTLAAGWDRNWRYYLNREVKTHLDMEWTKFEYDPRTAWEHQLWFPTGNFWLETGHDVVSVDRLTLLGETRAIRLQPALDVPLFTRRDVRFAYRGTLSTVALDKRPRYAESLFRFGFDVTRTLRFNSDTRWVKYDAPALSLGRGYVSTFAEALLHPAPALEVSFGFGVDPNVLDPVTNEYADIGRELFLFDRNANGFIAETNDLSLAPQIASAEQALQDLRRFQVRAIVRF